MAPTAPRSTPDDDDEGMDADVCVHGRPFDVICVECCPEDDDGSDTGDAWSEA